MAKKKVEQTPEEKMEKNEAHNDGTSKGLSKTIIGTIGTIVTAGGAAVISMFSGKKEEKVQPQSINISVPSQQPVQQSTKTVIIKEKAKETKEEPKPKKKDEFKEEAPKW
jgi:flagellar basal body-associated protein FliL